MSQGNGSLGGADVENRVVSVAYPLTIEEFRTYYDQGYQVATTAEQRAAWGLDPVDSLSVLSHEQALRVLFAEPPHPGPGVGPFACGARLDVYDGPAAAVSHGAC